LGTGLTVSIKVQLKKVDLNTMEQRAKEQGCTVQKVEGEDCVYEVKNRRKFGSVEEVAAFPYNAVASLIDQELK